MDAGVKCREKDVFEINPASVDILLQYILLSVNVKMPCLTFELGLNR